MNRSDTAGAASIPSAAPPRWAYFALFTLSGFSGLIYESIWSHYLRLFLGHAAYAQSLVLMIFMGGLALGSWLVAQFATRWRRPILAYAVVEGVIGLLALGFHDAFVAMTDTFYLTILPGIGSPTSGTILKWTASALLMLPQAVLLGMTFPLLSGGVLRRYPANPGGSLAMLYFTNSIGGAIGVLVSGFWLIGAMGLPGTIRTAGLLNLLLAVSIVWLLSRDRYSARGSIESRPRSAGAITVARLFLLAAFVTGLASFIYEIAWIRMLSLVLGSTTHSFELMLSAFIGGLAIGGLWIRRRIDTVSDPIRFAALVQVAMGVLAVVSIPVYGESFAWMAEMVRQLPPTDTGYALFTIGSHSIAMAIMLPTTVLAGMTLPLFTHVMLKQGHGEAAIGQVYAANTIGAIAGVLFAVHLGLPLLGLERLLGAGAMLDVCLGIVLLSFGSRAGRLKETVACSSLAIGTIALILSYAEVGPKMLASGVFRYGQPSLPEDSMVTFLKHGKTATVSVAEYTGGYLVIATNGKPDASIRTSPLGALGVDEGTMLLLAAVPLAYMPGARRVANIGFGSGLTAHTLLTDPDVGRLDTIEIEPVMVEGARQAYRRNRRVYDDPRSHIHFEDAKTFFSIRHEQYDIIVSEPSNPWVSGVSSLFSTEFYERAQARLVDDGIFAQWVQFYEFNDELVFSILKAFAMHFSDFAIYNIGPNDGLVVGRKSGALGDPDLEALFRTGLGEELRRGGIPDANNIRGRRIVDKAKLDAWLRDSSVPPNSDYYPYVDQHAAEARFKQQVAVSFSR